MVIGDIIISNEKEFEKKKKIMQEEGAKNLHVLSDFDRTITYGLDKNGRTPTVVSQLRSDTKYLGANYLKEAYKLFNIYHPIEINPNISLKEKKRKMDEWWTKHFNLIAKTGFTKKLIEQVVREKSLKFRKGSLEFLSFLEKKKIPIIFMSASPGDMLIEYLRQSNLLLPNIYIISNLYEWDKNGNAIQIKKPVVTSVNKDETLIHKFPVYDKIKDRKNVLLLGDGAEDVGMIKGFDYNTLIKIAFLNENVEENLPSFKKIYDIILLGDQDMSYINKFVRDILK